MARFIKIKTKGPEATSKKNASTATATTKTSKVASTPKSSVTTVTSLGNIKGKNGKNIPGNALVVYNRFNPQVGATAYQVTGTLNQRAKDNARAQFAKANKVTSNDTNCCFASHYRKNIWGK